MSRPTTRVLTMLELLQDRHSVGGREIAERLEVDQRTVRRYATRLQELGYPVEAERGPYGGYRLRPGYKLPPLMLTDDEATAVVLGLLNARQLGLAVDGALAKVGRVLPLALRERVRAVQEVLGFTRPPRSDGAPELGVLLTLAEGAQRRRRVALRYASYRGEETDREVDPYGLVAHAARWYLAAYDHLRGEVRTFRVDRIRSAELLAAAAPAPEDFDAVEHVTRSLARVPRAWEVEVVLLDATLEEARRWLPATFYELSEDPEGVLLSVRAERLEDAARMCASLGWRFVVRRPDELRDALRELGGRLIEAGAPRA